MYACVAVGCLGLTGAVAGAQEVIHAMTGTIRSIDSAHKTFTLFRENGSQLTFNDMTASNVRIMANDKKIISDAIAARAFDKKGAYAIVFYFGSADNPTAVAGEALGPGPFTSTVGTVAGFDEKDRLISVQDKSGSIQNYKIGAGTIAESGLGIVDGPRLHAEKGQHVRVVGANTNSGPKALFVNEM
jgi:hypothetical protein